jgi:hypothetical protein
MPVENDFLPFAIGVGANVLDQTDYVAAQATWGGTGFETGTAISDQLNKVWRQSSFVTAAIAAFMANTLDVNILDDGDLAEFVTNFTDAVQAAAGIRNGRLYASNATLAVLASDYSIGVQRSAPVLGQVAQLPVPATNQEFQIQDVSGNFNAYPLILTPPAGHNIAGLPANQTWPLNVNRGTWIMHYYGSSTWGIARCDS